MQMEVEKYLRKLTGNDYLTELSWEVMTRFVTSISSSLNYEQSCSFIIDGETRMNI